MKIHGTPLSTGAAANFIGAGAKALALVSGQLDPEALRIWELNQGLLQGVLRNALDACDDEVCYRVDQPGRFPPAMTPVRPELEAAEIHPAYLSRDRHSVVYRFGQLSMYLLGDQERNPRTSGLQIYTTHRDRFQLHQCLSLADGEAIVTQVGLVSFVRQLGKFKNGGQLGILPLWRSAARDANLGNKLCVPCVGLSESAGRLEIWWRYLEEGWFGNAPTVLLR